MVQDFFHQQYHLAKLKKNNNLYFPSILGVPFSKQRFQFLGHRSVREVAMKFDQILSIFNCLLILSMHRCLVFPCNPHLQLKFPLHENPLTRKRAQKPGIFSNGVKQVRGQDPKRIGFTEARIVNYPTYRGTFFTPFTTTGTWRTIPVSRWRG